ncbi:MAG: ABC transporter permease [Dethiobacter sp.]|jgi:putative ABC transport system permease protein|nr:MAG: ABC transporter permease [Dethiobacter sp.]
MNLFTIIWDGLRRRKIRSVLSILGIAIAATALFNLLALKQGYESGMQKELENMGAQVVAVAKGCPYEAIAVIMIGGQVPATLPEEALEQIRSVPNIATASPNVYGAYNYLDLSHPLIGITPEELKLKSWWKIQGRFPENFGEIVLGSVEAAVFTEKSGEFSQIGDTITVDALGKAVSLKVVGILESTGSKDDYSTFTTLETAQKLFNLEGRVVAVNIRVNEISQIPQTIEALEAIPDVQAVTIAQVLGTIRNLVATGQNMLLVVMLVAMIIGGLGTMNTMLMTVFERTREIGLMKAIGASRLQVFKLFLLEGMFISLAGSLIGVAAGSAATLMGDQILKNFVSVMPTQPIGQLSWYAAAVSILFPVTVGIFSSIYPAFRAAGLNPVEALKNE